MRNSILGSLKEVVEMIADRKFKSLSKDQKRVLKDRFNTLINFEYCEDGGYCFIMPSDNFKSFEYCYGPVYDPYEQEIKLDIDGYTFVIYSYSCKRAGSLFELLKDIEKNDK